MSSSSYSMAAAAASSPLSNLSCRHSLTHCFIPTHHHFPSSLSRPPKSLKLKAQYPTSPQLSLLSFPPFRCFSSALDGLQVTEDSQDDTQTETETEPETETDAASGAEEKSEPRGADSSSEEGRLYVGNLPYSMTSTQLAEVFEEAGTVVSAEIVYDRVTDRSRGFGFVAMGTVQEAKEAIRLFDGSQIGGRTVKVNFPEVPRGGERAVMGPKIQNSYRGFVDSPYKIYAGNLGWRLTSQGLRDAFADQPGLLSAKVIYERDTGRSRGFGFISFETAEDLQSALNAMNGVEVEGRPLRLNVAAERAPSAPPPVVESNENSLDSSELLSSISS